MWSYYCIKKSPKSTKFTTEAENQNSSSLQQGSALSIINNAMLIARWAAREWSSGQGCAEPAATAHCPVHLCHSCRAWEAKQSLCSGLLHSVVFIIWYSVLFIFFNITCRKLIGMCQPPALRHCSAAGCVLVAERDGSQREPHVCGFHMFRGFQWSVEMWN